MQTLIRFIATHLKYVILIVTLLLSLVIMGLNKEEKTNLAKAGSLAFIPAQRLLFHLVRMGEINEENRRLRLANTRLSLQVERMKGLKEENQRLRRMLDFKERAPLQLVPAEVIGRGPERAVNSLIIDVGEREGVRKNQPVIVADGLVGRVIGVRGRRSTVLLLLDPDCKASSLVERSRVYSIMECDGGRCNLKGVPLHADVQEGDEVATSGWGGIFPPGLKLGTVKKVSADNSKLLKEIEVDPAVDFTSLEEVFLLQKGTEPD